MSIGNTKDQGNKGNNFPYQKAVLQLLGQIASSSPSGSGATEATLQSVLDNVTSKIERIKGAANYNRAISYVDPGTGDFRVSQIIHTGNTLLGTPETIIETFTYYPATDNVTNIQYTP